MDAKEVGLKVGDIRKKMHIRIYTDGACSGNPGPGGWAALLLIKSDRGKETVTIKGGEKFTTNNRMELTAVIEGLRFVSKNLRSEELTITVVADSSYVINGVDWSKKWVVNDWTSSKGEPIQNKDLWMKFMELENELNIQFEKVKGHNGNRFNEHVDAVAVSERVRYKGILNNC